MGQAGRPPKSPNVVRASRSAQEGGSGVGGDTLRPEEPAGHWKLLSGFSKCGLQGPAEKASPGDLLEMDPTTAGLDWNSGFQWAHESENHWPGG